jgi:hypothetical protein
LELPGRTHASLLVGCNGRVVKSALGCNILKLPKGIQLVVSLLRGQNLWRNTHLLGLNLNLLRRQLTTPLEVPVGASCNLAVLVLLVTHLSISDDAHSVIKQSA